MRVFPNPATAATSPASHIPSLNNLVALARFRPVPSADCVDPGEGTQSEAEAGLARAVAGTCLRRAALEPLLRSKLHPLGPVLVGAVMASAVPGAAEVEFAQKCKPQPPLATLALTPAPALEPRSPRGGPSTTRQRGVALILSLSLTL